MSAPAFTPCSQFPGYEVSRDGRVRSFASNWRGYGSRELSQTLNASGYPSVRLQVRGKRKHIAVHRLVARAFLPTKPVWADQICHIDGDPLNNNASNLEWGDAATNAADRSRHGRAARITPEKRARMRAGYQRHRAALAAATGEQT